jgi:hypothetical protein
MNSAISAVEGNEASEAVGTAYSLLPPLDPSPRGPLDDDDDDDDDDDGGGGVGVGRLRMVNTRAFVPLRMSSSNIRRWVAAWGIAMDAVAGALDIIDRPPWAVSSSPATQAA